MKDTRAPFGLDVIWTGGGPARTRVDPKLFALLSAIDRTKKITTAAADVGMNYRQAWGLIVAWSETLGQPLVRKERGKGTSLTPLGESLHQAHSRTREKLEPHLKQAASEIDRALSPLLTNQRDPLRLNASHDLLLTEFRDMLESKSGTKLDMQIAGSLGSIVALCKSQCDIAGFHFPDGELGQDVLREFRPWLKPRTQILIHFVRRSQGLIVARGNPLKIRGLSDIVKTKARFINRQRGSGTQIALDFMLQRSGIDKKKINGYSNEEYTHGAIASAVASGIADVGLGIETAARKLNTGFVPLFAEDYYLLVKRETLDHAGLKSVLSAIRSKAFLKMAGKFSGYDASRAGTFVEIADAIAG